MATNHFDDSRGYAAKRRLPVVGSGRAERVPSVVDADVVADKAAVAVGDGGDKSLG